MAKQKQPDDALQPLWWLGPFVYVGCDDGVTPAQQIELQPGDSALVSERCRQRLTRDFPAYVRLAPPAEPPEKTEQTDPTQQADPTQQEGQANG